MKTKQWKITALGPCICVPFGLLSTSPHDYHFKAYVWIETETNWIEAVEYSYITIRLRLTKENEKSRLIQIWKNRLKSTKAEYPSLALEIGGINNQSLLRFASVWPTKIEDRYLFLSAGANIFGEIYSII